MTVDLITRLVAESNISLIKSIPEFSGKKNSFSDKCPIHIIEQELSVLRQGSMSVVEYYNLVNNKLPLLANKTITTHGTVAITKELNKNNRDYSLCIFITGLNASLKGIIFSLCPQDFPDALVKAQKI